MEQGGDTPTTCGFIGQKQVSVAQTADSNSGIPAWRVCKVGLILPLSE